MKPIRLNRYKPVLHLLPVVASLGLLVSCNNAGTAQEVSSYPDTTRFQQYDVDNTPVTIIKDHRTGCEYMSIYHGGIVLVEGTCQGTQPAETHDYQIPRKP